MNQTLKIILWLIGALLICFLVYYFRILLSYILVAALISILGDPLVRLIRKLKIKSWQVPRWLASTITLITFIYLITLFFKLFGPLIAEEARVIAQIDVEQTATKLEGQITAFESFMSQLNLSGDDRSNREFILERLKNVVDFGYLSNIFNNIFSIVGNAFVAAFSILFMAFFFLKDEFILRRIVSVLTPEKYLEKVQSILKKARHHLSRYFLGVLAQVTLIVILVTMGLTILGVENALIIGFLAGVVNVVPYIGPIVGTVIGLFIAITTNLNLDIQSGLLPLSLKVLLVFVIVQLIDNFFTQPVIIGNSVKAHPLEIFIVISAAATAGGIVGMVVAIPAYTMLRIIAKEFLSGLKVVASLTKDI